MSQHYFPTLRDGKYNLCHPKPHFCSRGPDSLSAVANPQSLTTVYSLMSVVLPLNYATPICDGRKIAILGHLFPSSRKIGFLGHLFPSLTDGNQCFINIYISVCDGQKIAILGHLFPSRRKIAFWGHLFPSVSDGKYHHPFPIDHCFACNNQPRAQVYELLCCQWLSGRASDLRSSSRGFEARPRRCCVTTLGKLFTPYCLCHQAV